MTAEVIYERRWALAILESVLRRSKNEYQAAHRNDRIVAPDGVDLNLNGLDDNEQLTNGFVQYTDANTNSDPCH